VLETALVTVPVLVLGLVKVWALVLDWAQGWAGGRFGERGRGLLLSLQPGIGLTGPNQSLILFLTGCRSWSRLRRR